MTGGGLDEPRHSAAYLYIGIGKPYAQVVCGVFVIYGHKFGLQAARLLLDHVDLSVRGKRPYGYAEVLRRRDALTAYGAGRA